MTHKIYIEDIMYASWANRYGLTHECSSLFVLFTSKTDFAFILYLSDVIRVRIGDLRQVFREAARTYLIVLSWNLQIQRLMRAFGIKDPSPAIKYLPALVKEFVATHRDNILFQGSMKSLFFSQGLGVIGAAMNDLNAQAHQPYFQFSIGTVGIIAPGRAIIHQYSQGQAVSAKCLDQVIFDGLVPFIGAGGYTLRKSGNGHPK